MKASLTCITWRIGRNFQFHFMIFRLAIARARAGSTIEILADATSPYYTVSPGGVSIITKSLDFEGENKQDTMLVANSIFTGVDEVRTFLEQVKNNFTVGITIRVQIQMLAPSK